MLTQNKIFHGIILDIFDEFIKKTLEIFHFKTNMKLDIVFIFLAQSRKNIEILLRLVSLHSHGEKAIKISLRHVTRKRHGRVLGKA